MEQTQLLLAGPAHATGAESLAAHVARLGPLPPPERDIFETLDQSGLLGRGGAAFPAGRKWRAVAARGRADARVLVNGAEGEPLSAKDRTLMALRPQLVLDGALMAAQSVGAREIVLYVGAAHRPAQAALGRALLERQAGGRRLPVSVRMFAAPDAYVAGEESAAVHYVNEGDARPTTKPPRPFESGVGGCPTLVHNVETLARVALIARAGRSVATVAAATGSLVTVRGAPRPGVYEVTAQTTVADLAARAGLERRDTAAVLLGGFFGAWVPVERAMPVAIGPAAMGTAGLPFGCGVVAFAARGECGVAATARILDYLAGQSAAQCGPCVFGLRAVADTAATLAAGRARGEELAQLERWRKMLIGRGACRHPDGAAGLLASALATFGDEFALHAHHRRCTGVAHLQGLAA